MNRFFNFALGIFLFSFSIMSVSFSNLSAQEEWEIARKIPNLKRFPIMQDRFLFELARRGVHVVPNDDVVADGIQWMRLTDSGSLTEAAAIFRLNQHLVAGEITAAQFNELMNFLLSGVGAAAFKQTNLTAQTMLELALELQIALTIKNPVEAGSSPFSSRKVLLCDAAISLAPAVKTYLLADEAVSNSIDLKGIVQLTRCNAPADPLSACLKPLMGPSCSRAVSFPVREGDRALFNTYYDDLSYRADINANGIIDLEDRNLFNDGVLGYRSDIVRVYDSRSGSHFARRLSTTEVLADMREYFGADTCSQHAATIGTETDMFDQLSPWYYTNLAGSTQGKASVFIRGSVDFSNRFHAVPRVYSDNPVGDEYNFKRLTPVCLSDLGHFNSETGARLPYNSNPQLSGDNNGELQGKMFGIDFVNLTNYEDGIFSPNNDFRFYRREDLNPPSMRRIQWRSTSAVPQPSSTGLPMAYDRTALALIHNYFFFTDVHNRILNSQFYSSLGLSADILKNVTTRFFRVDGLPDPGGTIEDVRRRANLLLGMSSILFLNIQLAIGQNQFNPLHYFNPQVPVGPASVTFGSFEVLDALGLVAYWLQAVPTRRLISDASNPNFWRYHVWGSVNDLFSNWFAMRYGQINNDPEAENIFRLGVWIEQGLASPPSNCGLPGNLPQGWEFMSPAQISALGLPSRLRPECAPKFSIKDSVRTFDESPDAVLKGNVNIVPRQSGLGSYYSPTAVPVLSDDVGLMLTAIFYDLADDFGLGFPAVDRLLVKSVSLIDRVEPFHMRYFAHLVREAARRLWPDSTNPIADPIPGYAAYYSLFEDQIRLAFLRRGIPIDARFICSDASFPNAPGCCPSASSPDADGINRCRTAGTANAQDFLNLRAPHRLLEPAPYLAVGLREVNPSSPTVPQPGSGYFENSPQMTRWRSAAAPLNTTQYNVIRTGLGSSFPMNHSPFNPTATATTSLCQTDFPSKHWDPAGIPNGYTSPPPLNHRCGFEKGQNIYTHPELANYVAYRFMLGSEVGPEDIVRLSNIPVSSESFTSVLDARILGAGEWFYRTCPTNLPPGQWCVELTGDELSNLVLMAPGRDLRFNRDARSVQTEASIDGANVITDVSPPGFRVVEAVKEGFSFRVQALITAGATRAYRFTVDDPSQQAGDVYTWRITRYQKSGNNFIRQVQAPVNGAVVTAYFTEGTPVDISLTRTRGGVSKELKITDAVNRLGRNGGSQFSLRVGSCVNPNCLP